MTEAVHLIGLGDPASADEGLQETAVRDTLAATERVNAPDDGRFRASPP